MSVDVQLRLPGALGMKKRSPRILLDSSSPHSSSITCSPSRLERSEYAVLGSRWAAILRRLSPSCGKSELDWRTTLPGSAASEANSFIYLLKRSSRDSNLLPTCSLEIADLISSLDPRKSSRRDVRSLPDSSMICRDKGAPASL